MGTGALYKIKLMSGRCQKKNQQIFATRLRSQMNVKLKNIYLATGPFISLWLLKGTVLKLKTKTLLDEYGKPLKTLLAECNSQFQFETLPERNSIKRTIFIACIFVIIRNFAGQNNNNCDGNKNNNLHCLHNEQGPRYLFKAWKYDIFKIIHIKVIFGELRKLVQMFLTDFEGIKVPPFG